MKIVRTAAQMSSEADRLRRAGRKIAFVATMGALHEGHLSLLREAGRRGDVVVASIYVNPRQFDDPEDFRRYARNIEGDLEQCEAAGVDIVFAPTDAEIYPTRDDAVEVPVPNVAYRLEGASRPGHFDGVVAVVSRLFRIVKPHAALFGMKDYQQVRVIEEMVKQQKMEVSIVPCPTVRDPDGLAMSSRNARLSSTGRRKALALSKAIRAAAGLYRAGERSASALRAAAVKELTRDAAVRLDYAEVVDAETLEDAATLHRPALVAVAAFIEDVRLIDNGLLNEV